jgi:hypothetical protein
MSDTCKHGLLTRSCEICERDAEIAVLSAEVERLKAGVRFWNETAIEYKRQLYETIRRGPESAGLHIITDEQIDAAWKMVRGWQHGGGTTTEDFRLWMMIFKRMSIVECSRCGGSGRLKRRATESALYPPQTCPRCQGHGWIRDERGDE